MTMLKLDLTADPHTEENPHRPELRIWVDNEDEDEKPKAVLLVGPLFAQMTRYVEMTPDEARSLAKLLNQAADEIK